MPILPPIPPTPPAEDTGSSSSEIAIPGLTGTTPPAPTSYNSVVVDVVTAQQYPGANNADYIGSTNDVASPSVNGSQNLSGLFRPDLAGGTTKEPLIIGTKEPIIGVYSKKQPTRLLNPGPNDFGGGVVPSTFTTPLFYTTTSVTGVSGTGPTFGLVSAVTGSVGFDSAEKIVSLQNLPFRPNHRFRGIRESKKFLLLAQKMIANIFNIREYLKTVSASLDSTEDGIYPTDAQIGSMQHCLVQAKFFEDVRLKPTASRWFN
jgi:hypothetical protein